MAGRDKRQSNIELFRIISILLIIMHHIMYHGGAQFDAGVISVNRLWNQLNYYAGHAGLDAFIMISGYFMVQSNRLNLARIAKMWLQMLFYSVVIYFLAVFCFGFPLEGRYVLIAFTPFISQGWPFASSYLAMCIFAPFVSILLRKLSKKQYRLLLLVIFIMWVVIPTISTSDAEGNYLTWMLSLYAIGAYIKLYPDDFTGKAKTYFAWSAVIALLTYASCIVFDVIGLKIPLFARYATHFSSNQHLNIVVWGILLFVGCLKSPMKTSKLINSVSGLLFGVYLIHDNFFGRQILWDHIFDNRTMADSPWYILYTIMELVVVFAGTALIEFIRQKTIERWYSGSLNKIFEKPQKKVDEILNHE